MTILVADISGTSIKAGKIEDNGVLTKFQEIENDGKKGGRTHRQIIFKKTQEK